MVLHADEGRESAEIMKFTGGKGVDVAFEAGDQNDAVETAIATIKPGGRVVLIGIPSDNRTSFASSVARRKGLIIVMVRRMKHTYPRAIRLVESGLVDVRSLVGHRFLLTDFEQALKLARKREGLKIIIEPW